MSTLRFFGENCAISCAALEILSVLVLVPELSPPDSSCPHSCAHPWAKGKASGICWFLHNPKKPTGRVSACLPSTAIAPPGEAVLLVGNFYMGWDYNFLKPRWGCLCLQIYCLRSFRSFHPWKCSWIGRMGFRATWSNGRGHDEQSLSRFPVVPQILGGAVRSPQHLAFPRLNSPKFPSLTLWGAWVEPGVNKAKIP